MFLLIELVHKLKYFTHMLAKFDVNNLRSILLHIKEHFFRQKNDSLFKQLVVEGFLLSIVKT